MLLGMQKKDHAKSTWESAEAWYTDKLVLCVLRFIKAEENATLMKANFMGSGRKEEAVCAQGMQTHQESIKGQGNKCRCWHLKLCILLGKWEIVEATILCRKRERRVRLCPMWFKKKKKRTRKSVIWVMPQVKAIFAFLETIFYEEGLS